MKKIIKNFIIILIVITGISNNNVFAQTIVDGIPPEGIVYQAEARDERGKIIANSILDVKITIFEEVSGNVWIGHHEIITNEYGMFVLVIGTGTENEGYVFEDIAWESGSYFLNVGVKKPNKEDYNDMGTTQLLSVPYAIHAKTAESVLATETDPVYSVDPAASITDAGSGMVITDAERTAIGTNKYEIDANAELITTKVEKNNEISGGTKTKITFDSKGLVIYGTNATTADIDESTNRHYVTDLQQVIIQNTSGENTGDQDLSALAKQTDIESLQSKINTLEERIETLEGGPVETVTDIDGNTYKTIRIGTQVWMAENLKTSRYNDGEVILTGTNISSSWYDLTDGAYGFWNDTYGFLYNWHAVGTNKLCPVGWHVPSDGEWKILADFLGGWEIAGGKLKEIGTTHWMEPNFGASNESGFTALPGALITFQGDMPPPGSPLTSGFGYWWTSTDYWIDSYNHSAYCRMMTYYSEMLLGDTNPEGGWRVLDTENGFSVRCVKN